MSIHCTDNILIDEFVFIAVVIDKITVLELTRIDVAVVVVAVVAAACTTHIAIVIFVTRGFYGILFRV